MNQEEAAEHLISTLYPPTLNLYTVHLAKALQTLYPPALNLYTGHLPGESTANLSSNLELVHCSPCELVHCTLGKSTTNLVSPKLELVHCTPGESTANLSSNLADLENVLSASAMLYPTFCSGSK